MEAVEPHISSRSSYLYVHAFTEYSKRADIYIYIYAFTEYIYIIYRCTFLTTCGTPCRLLAQLVMRELFTFFFRFFLFFSPLSIPYPVAERLAACQLVMRELFAAQDLFLILFRRRLELIGRRLHAVQRQFPYFCTSKASKLKTIATSTALTARRAASVFVLLY